MGEDQVRRGGRPGLLPTQVPDVDPHGESPRPERANRQGAAEGNPET